MLSALDTYNLAPSRIGVSNQESHKNMSEHIVRQDCSGAHFNALVEHFWTHHTFPQVNDIQYLSTIMPYTSILICFYLLSIHVQHKSTRIIYVYIFMLCCIIWYSMHIHVQNKSTRINICVFLRFIISMLSINLR